MQRLATAIRFNRYPLLEISIKTFNNNNTV